jgi:hypothetical protein
LLAERTLKQVSLVAHRSTESQAYAFTSERELIDNGVNDVDCAATIRRLPGDEKASQDDRCSTIGADSLAKRASDCGLAGARETVQPEERRTARRDAPFVELGEKRDARLFEARGNFQGVRIVKGNVYRVQLVEKS